MNKNQINVPNKTKVAAILLAVFLGGVGAHRFYLGKPGTAILQLVMTCTFVLAVVTAIWVIVDVIMLATGSMKDQFGRDLV